MKKKYLLFLVVLFCTLSLFAQSNKEIKSEDQRIVSLSPAMTELVYALDCGSNLVARTDSCNYPEECLNVPSIGSSWMPSVELIVSYNPTVVLVSSLTDPDYVKAMEEANLNVKRIVFEETFEGTYDMIRQVGSALNKEELANKLATDSKERIEAVKNITSNLADKKTVLYVISWGEWGDYVATGDTFISGMIETAGGINAAKDGKYWSVSKELIVESDPDIILLADSQSLPANINAYKNTNPYSKLSGSILSFNADIIERQGIRTAVAVEELAKIINPELF